MKERLRYVDGLRGIAVLTVVLFHGGMHSAPLTAGQAKPLGFLLRQGCHGVDLFFILSGFCLAYPALAQLHVSGRANFRIAAFAARRAVRILPPYYAAIAAFAALGFTFLAFNVRFPDAMSSAALSTAAIVKQALFLDSDGTFLNGSFWSLAVEFRWYFLFPLVLLLWNRTPKAFAGIALAAVIAQATRMQSVDLFFLPLFMLGVVAADIYVRGVPVQKYVLPAACVSTVLALIISGNPNWYFYEKGPFWGVAAFCAVIAAGSTPLLQRALSSGWIVRIGTASYSIYLISDPIVELTERAAGPLFGPIAGFAASIAAAVVAGVVFSHVVERPFVDSALRSRLIARLEPSIAKVCSFIGLPGVIQLRNAPAIERREAIPA